MIKNLLIGFGLIATFLYHWYMPDMSYQHQLYFFFAGILLMGVPHGAADLLVAATNDRQRQKNFSTVHFLFIYLLRLSLFGLLIWFFPVIGNLLFVVIAAYHFGETDLCHFKTDKLTGKLFVIFYGLLILGMILLHHFAELVPMFYLFPSGVAAGDFIQLILVYRYYILAFIFVAFVISSLIYFTKHEISSYHSETFIIHLGLLICILYVLPMILSFTFYFIFWHSFLSINNIFIYLKQQGNYTKTRTIRQMVFYSLPALLGISLAGTGGFMFINKELMVVYVFLGLAVLTAPHLQVMHEMYGMMRRGKSQD
ncbi:MAG: Brp/Blh family beta-carotene 15,15'-dioxygenase [Bacteroidetes bacterium]|nr:Brp/Blh family beta-carotene 15,15'-dioxygenase [Bacteroidota bacterium]